MRTVILFTAVFIVSLHSFAQPTYIYQFEKPDTVIKSVYNHLKVIDRRSDTTNLGHIKKGAFNRITDVIPGGPLAKLLEGYFVQLQPNGSNGNKELLLVMYGMKIEDRPDAGEMGTFYFDGDFFSGENGQYQYLGKMDSIFEVSSSFDVTKKLLDASHYVISDLLVYYATTAKPVSSETCTEIQATQRRAKVRQQYPIYHADSFKRGIYRNVDQFLANQPLDTPFVGVAIDQRRPPTVTYHYYNAKGKAGKRIDESTFFAIYDGKEWTVSDGNHKGPMIFQNGDFYSNQVFMGISNNSGTMVMFGLAGVLISSAIEKHGKGLYRACFDPEIKDFRPFKRLR